MLQVVGIVHAVGEYNGVKYDNYNLHCIRGANSENESGSITEIVKVKSSLFNEISKIDIGAMIDISYDKFGRIKDIFVD